jgi:NOL1/NOP2/fmu family ribosome biogenesis protein
VYSTCTFNQLENEGTLQRFLEKNTDYQLEPIPPRVGFSPGIPTTDTDPFNLSRSVRIWPHLATGEGHFAARLKKTRGHSVSDLAQSRTRSELNPAQLAAYETFIGNNLNMTSAIAEISPGSEGLALYGNRLYWINPGSPILEGLKVHHWGWWLGTFQSDRFIPSPALATSINKADVQKVLEFSVGEPDLAAYQRGSPIKIPESIDLPGSWILVTVSGSPLGWGLTQNGRLKSYFPNWLRSN